MLHMLILKVTKFQLPTAKRFSIADKNILGAIMPPPYQIGVKKDVNSFEEEESTDEESNMSEFDCHDTINSEIMRSILKKFVNFLNQRV